MRKVLIINVLIVILSFKLISQNVSIGPIVGFNLSSKNNSPDLDLKQGFTGGIFLNYSTKTDFGFNGSLIYSRLGYKVALTNTFVKLNYLQVPINLVYYFGEGMKQGSFRPKVFFGPYAGLLLDAESPKQTPAETLKQMNELDLGLNIGGGFNYALRSKTWINVDAKYGFGLTEVPKIGAFQNRAFSISCGLSIPLGNYDRKTGKLRR